MLPKHWLKGIKLSDLIEIATSNIADPYKIIEKTFEWRHSRFLEIGKWFVAIGSALIAASMANYFKTDILHEAIILPIGLFGGILSGIGIIYIFRSTEIEVQLASSQVLLSKLLEMKPFLITLAAEDSE